MFLIKLSQETYKNLRFGQAFLIFIRYSFRSRQKKCKILRYFNKFIPIKQYKVTLKSPNILCFIYGWSDF